MINHALLRMREQKKKKKKRRERRRWGDGEIEREKKIPFTFCALRIGVRGGGGRDQRGQTKR